MPDPPVIPVVPHGKGLLQPLHYRREFQAVCWLDVKGQPVIGKTQPANREDKPKGGLTEHLVKQGQGMPPAEQGFPVVDPGTDCVPHPLFQFT
jgi:hypothetical protein